MPDYDLTLPDDFDGKVRLFPLPNVVLFPGIIQGLHIFEPRYREMMADAVAHDGLITMAVELRDPAVQPVAPRLFPLVCIGRIVSHTLLDDGRYNLLLLGLRRARLIAEFTTSRAWRTARVDLVRESCSAPPDEISSLRDRLMDAFRTMASGAGIDLEPFNNVDPRQIPLGMLADTIAYTSSLPLKDMLTVLETIDVAVRADRVIQLVRAKLAGSQMDHDRGFPPEFSPN